MFENQKQAFSNGGDFKFIFVGNIDLEKAKPLFEQYIGSLPSTKKSVEPELDDLYIAEGLRENRFETRMQTPKVTVLNAYTGAIDYNLKNIISVNLFQQIMSMVYTKTIREEEGGTYGVSVRANIDDARKRFTYQYSFDTNEEKRQQLEDRAFVELKNIAENGPSEEFLGNAVEYSVKSYNDNIKTNGYWVSAISMRESFGLERHNEYIDILKSVSTNDIKDIASYILDQNNRVQVV